MTFLNFLLNPCFLSGGFVVLQKLNIMLAILLGVAIITVIGTTIAIIVVSK